MTDAEAYRYLELAGEQYPSMLSELRQMVSMCQLTLNAIKAAVAAEREACAEIVADKDRDLNRQGLAAAIRARKGQP